MNALGFLINYLGRFWLGVRTAVRLAFFCLPKRKSAKKKAPLLASALRADTLRCSPGRAQPELAALRATQTSGCFIPAALRCSALRQGDPIQTSSLRSLRSLTGPYRPNDAKGESDRDAASRSNFYSPIVMPKNAEPGRLYSGPVARRWRRAAAKGVRRTAPVRPACLSVAKATRVLAANPSPRASECTGVAGAVPGCPFSWAGGL